MKITVLTGRYAGRSANYAGDPMPVLVDLAHHDERWQVDWDSAKDDSELFVWARADLAMSCVSALMHGRSVTFQGETYRATECNLKEALAYVEDEIVGSGFNVGVEKDDETGVYIGTKGKE